MTVVFWCFEYFTSWIEGILCCIFCAVFLTKDMLKENLYPIILMSGIGAVCTVLLNRLHVFLSFHMILIILLYVIMQCILYRKKVWLIFASTMIYSVILVASELSVAYFLASIIDTVNPNLFHERSVNWIVCAVISKFILFLIVIMVRRIYRHEIILGKKYAVTMGIYSIFLLTFLLVMAEFSMNTVKLKMSLFLLFFIISIISIIMELLTLSFVIEAGESYEQKQRAEFIELKNSMLQQSLNETKQAFQLWRKSIHDYKNNVLVLSQLAQNDDIEGIKKYLKKETALIDRKIFCIHTGNSVIDVIINTKQHFAEAKGILFVVNAFLPKHGTIRDLDLANILGNLLDNAIEASMEEQDPYIDAIIRQEKSFMLIKVTNKYCGELPGNMRSSKKNKIFHGIGIESVKSTVEKYHGEFSIKKQDNEVVVQILLLNQ